MAITTLNNRSINRSDTASADQVWTATSATASDFQAAGGGVLQVKSTTKTDTQTIASTSATAISSLTVSLTPSSASNKILLFGSVSFGGAANLYGQGSIYRQINSGGYSQLSTAIGNTDSNATRCTIPMQLIAPANANEIWKVIVSSFNFLDNPNTTSQVDYQIHCRSDSSVNIRINEEDDSSDGDYDARPITTITALEIDSGVL
jgi:hypothetical protein